MSMTQRFASLVYLAASLHMMLVVSGCSFLIDLPADCTPEDCNGFTCNAEQTECLFVCESNDQCSDGFSCSSFSGGGLCVTSGCEPRTAIRPFLEGADSTSRAKFSSNATGDLLVAVYNTTGNTLKVQVYDALGAAMGDAIELERSSEMPGGASIIWTGSGWGIVWEATGEVGDPGNERLRDLLRFATLNADGSLGVAPTTLWYAQGDTKSVDNPSVTWDPQAELFVTVWSTQIASQLELYMLRFRPDGSSADGTTPIPREEGIRITLSESDTFDPQVTLRPGADGMPNVYDVTYREGRDRISLTLRTVDSTGQKAFPDDIDLGMNAEQTQISSYGYSRISTGTVAAFSEQSSGTKAFRAQLLPDRVLASLSGVTRFEVGAGLQDVEGAQVASVGAGEYGVLFTASLEERGAVYFTRYQDDGQIIDGTFEASDITITNPTQPLLTALPGGYALFYTDANDGPLGQIWDCAAP